jgi:hypothetical protein
VKRPRTRPFVGGSAVLVAVLAAALLLPGSAIAAQPPQVTSVAGAAMGGSAFRTAKESPPFKIGKWRLQSVPWRKLPLNGGPPMPLETVGLQDAQGIPMRRFGTDKQLVYNPTVLAQQGMKRLDAWRQSGDRAHLRVARKIMRKLDEISLGGGERRWQPHAYDLLEQEAGWVNANSHGLVLSFFSRYVSLLDADTRIRDARRLLAAFEGRRGDRRWFTDITPKGLVWFEHWPKGIGVHTLNAHMNALFGLYDYWSVTGSRKAQRYFLGGARTVRVKLDRFRRKGDLSRYSLGRPGASLHYHHTHIRQLRALARMTGDEWFARQAKLFVHDEKVWRANGGQE